MEGDRFLIGSKITFRKKGKISETTVVSFPLFFFVSVFFSGETEPSIKISDIYLNVLIWFVVVVANCVMCYNNCGEAFA